MGIFGWSYPPGAENDPNAPYNQTGDEPCDVCGQAVDNCICPECTVCQVQGDMSCYDDTIEQEYIDGKWQTVEDHPCNKKHGMIRSFAQVALRLEAERQWEEDARATAEGETEWIETLKEIELGRNLAARGLTEVLIARKKK